MDYELSVLRDAVQKAGKRVLQLAADGFETIIKKDRSPVTTADLEVNRILHEALTKAVPEDGWLSEETADDLRRLGKRRVWIVDPIDGTKYFMRGIPQYAISVALVEEGTLLLGVIYNPASNELFYAIRGKGVWLNDTPIRAGGVGKERLVIFLNPGGFERGRFKAVEAAADCRPMGSIAYTLAQVACGRADGTINLDRMNEWDVAAGVLLIEEAGGSAADSTGQPLTFNRTNTSVHGIIAAGTGLYVQVRALAQKLSPARGTPARAPDRRA